MDDKPSPQPTPDLGLAPDEPSASRVPPAPANGDRRLSNRHQPLFRDDVVIAASLDEDTTDYERLQPAEGLSPAARRAITTDPIAVTIEEEPERPLLQFTMTELFWLMSFLSVGFAVMYYLPPDKVGGVLGLLALFGQGLLMRFPPDNRHVRIGASVLLIMYACAAAVAFVQHIFFPPS